MFLDVNRPGL